MAFFLNREQYKAAFFALTQENQRFLRLFIALLSISECAGCLLNWSSLTHWTIPGIALNLTWLYWTLALKKAPSFYFACIPIAFWFVLIFDGLDVVSVFSSPDSFGPTAITSVLNLLLIAIFSRVIFSYRNQLRELKSRATIDITEVEK